MLLFLWIQKTKICKNYYTWSSLNISIILHVYLNCTDENLTIGAKCIMKFIYISFQTIRFISLNLSIRYPWFQYNRQLFCLIFRGNSACSRSIWGCCKNENDRKWVRNDPHSPSQVQYLTDVVLDLCLTICLL